MKYLKILSLLLILGLVLNTNAQQDFNFNMYKYNLSVVNPAVAGTSNGIEFYAGFREQWTSNESPSTQIFNVNTIINNKLSIGLNAINDKTFVIDQVHLYFDLSYNLQISKSTYFYLGIKGGGSFLDINLNSPGIQNNPFLLGNVRTFNPNAGIGAYVQGKKYYLSISAPGLFKNDRIEEDGIQGTAINNRVNTFLSGGYDFDLNKIWILKASTLARIASGAPLVLDLTLLANFIDKFEFGVNYRINESYTGIVTFDIKSFAKLGFAYENRTNDNIAILNNGVISNSGTIEVFLKFSSN